MWSNSYRLMPVVGFLRKAVQPANVAVCRNFWGPPEIRSIVRDVDRQLDKLERDFFKYSPLRRLLPRSIPIEGTGAVTNSYQLNIDVQGYKPEEISVSVKDNVLSIKAQMERSAEDGSKFYQEVKREFTLPDNIDPSNLKSFLGSDGILAIEAPFKPEEKPKEIPVSKS